MKRIRAQYSENVARITAGLVLKDLVPMASNARRATVQVAPLARAEQPEWHHALVDLIEDGISQEFCRNAMVHGSFGDRTPCQYSDLDMTILLHDDILASEAGAKVLGGWLRKKVFPFLVSIVPLQHHGPFLLWSDLLENYSQRILPLCAYSSGNAWSVSPETLEFVVNESDERSRHCVRTSRAVAKPESSFYRYGKCLYQQKRFLSNAMLVPALYFSDISSPVHKRDSFERFDDEFPAFRDLFRYLADVRDRWPKCGGLHQRVAEMTSSRYSLFRSAQVCFRKCVELDEDRISTGFDQLAKVLEERLA